MRDRAVCGCAWCEFGIHAASTFRTSKPNEDSAFWLVDLLLNHLIDLSAAVPYSTSASISHHPLTVGV